MLSGIQPTGAFHLGNYVGAVRHWANDQREHESFYCVVDLHALTGGDHAPDELRAATVEMAAVLLAAGIDPHACPVAIEEYERLLSLPLFPDLSEADQDIVIDCLKDVA